MHPNIKKPTDPKLLLLIKNCQRQLEQSAVSTGEEPETPKRGLNAAIQAVEDMKQKVEKSREVERLVDGGAGISKLTDALEAIEKATDQLKAIRQLLVSTEVQKALTALSTVEVHREYFGMLRRNPPAEVLALVRACGALESRKPNERIRPSLAALSQAIDRLLESPVGQMAGHDEGIW